MIPHFTVGDHQFPHLTPVVGATVVALEDIGCAGGRERAQVILPERADDRGVTADRNGRPEAGAACGDDTADSSEKSWMRFILAAWV